LVDLSVLFLLKGLIGAYVLAHGFSHVSDDDYARTVIAEEFAHHPRFDPSGTSWLPLPFWVSGAAMILCGRSLGAARAVAVVLGIASTAAPYAALRAGGASRRTSFVASAVAMAIPWNAWLGVATVPEAWAGAIAAAAMLAFGNPAARPFCAGALLAASLARYETWPACAVFAAFSLASATRRGFATPRDHAAREIVQGFIAMAGIALWMAWNSHAHGSALHFLDRVSAFRRASGSVHMPLREKLLDYPRALVRETPEAFGLGLVALTALIGSATYRRRWLPTSLAMLSVLAFLILGDVRDGAPTHHPERALTALWWLLIGLGSDAVAHGAATWRISRVAVAGVAGLAGVVWAASLPGRWRTAPGTSTWDRRDAQIARGLDLRTRRVASVDILPCSFEHFALLAAWGQPERARIEAPAHQPPTSACPGVIER
jgi:hypothetical protein